jgi:hypothetical protein
MFVVPPILQAVQPVPVPICFVAAWLLVILAVWSSFKAVQSITSQFIRMHTIPCSSCQFLTGNSCLKCTVHPSIALTEAAIDCSDYQNSDSYIRVLIRESIES